MKALRTELVEEGRQDILEKVMVRPSFKSTDLLHETSNRRPTVGAILGKTVDG
jgi:hypothetical protein